MAKSVSVKVCLKCRATYRTNRDTCPADGSELLTRDLPAGSIVAGKYRIGEEIGRGGMGVVCRGEHTIMGKEVAVKLINPLFSADPKFLEMFKSEARALGAFRHPNVLTVHDFGLYDGRYYLVMELLEGESLKEVMNDSGSIPPERAFAMLVTICRAVSAAHRVGIVHLDLKGENVFVKETTSGTELKVLDFGLARLAGGRAQDVDDGTAMGTIGYMAPEQIVGGRVDERADVYALGVLAFEMLTGELPFPAGSKSAIMRHQLEGRISKWPKSSFLKIVPKRTRQAVLDAVSADPYRRPQSVDELGHEFEWAIREIAGSARRLAGKHTRSAASRVGLLQRARGFFSRSEKPAVHTGPRAPEGMVYVPHGSFLMGSAHSNPDQTPAHRMPAGPFFIDVTPVTNRDYARFVEATDHKAPDTWKTLSYPPGEGDLPVTGVTWQDAADYAEWAGKRLPTEAEWEKAARGDDGRTFPWGAKWEPAFANWSGNPSRGGAPKIAPVGEFPDDLSPHGCQGMAGNVMEWTASWYLPYGRATHTSGDYGEKFRVARGGSYLSGDPAYLTCACRSRARPDSTGAIGFRCVQDIR
jgi:serine/threonine-protein kinase